MDKNHPFLQSALEQCPPDTIDKIWADGWRNFGTHFFRNQLDYLDATEQWVNIIPLRINLSKFSFSKSQIKLLQKNENQLVVNFKKIHISPSVEDLFYRHTKRFKHNIPDSIYNFLGDAPGEKPTLSLQCGVYDETNQLLAVSYFGVGEESISSIYAMFDTDFSHLRLGLYTLLQEIAFAQHHQKKYVYLGYAHDVASFYDYKKTFTA
jgi:leucyl-tRNA---protein transferase